MRSLSPAALLQVHVYCPFSGVTTGGCKDVVAALTREWKEEDLEQSLVEHLEEWKWKWIGYIFLDIDNKITRWDIWVEPIENTAI